MMRYIQQVFLKGLIAILPVPAGSRVVMVTLGDPPARRK